MAGKKQIPFNFGVTGASILESFKDSVVISQSLETRIQSANLKEIPSNIKLIPIESLKDAPEDWNFYKKYKDEKLIELIDSILEEGLHHNIVVWETTENGSEKPEYMILSGHNRVQAYKMISHALQDDKYKYILANVKTKEELTPEKAQEIIINANWIQRDLSPSEKSQSVCRKYAVLKHTRSDEHNRIRDIIAEEFGISGRQVQTYLSLANLIAPLLNLVDSGKASLKAGVRLSQFSKELQTWLYENFSTMLKTKYIMLLNAEMSCEDISKLFQELIDAKAAKAKQKKISFSLPNIPSSKEKELMALINEWAEKNNINISKN